MPKKRLSLSLTEVQLKELQEFSSEMARKKNLRARLRGNAVWWSHQGKTVEQIAGELGRSTRTIYGWLNRYQQKGIAGLYDRPRPIKKLTPEQIGQLLDVSNWTRECRDVKERRMRWSYRRIARWVSRQWNIRISHERVRQIIRRRLLGDTYWWNR